MMERRLAEAPRSRTEPPRVSREQPILKTGRATGPRSLPRSHYKSSPQKRLPTPFWEKTPDPFLQPRQDRAGVAQVLEHHVGSCGAERLNVEPARRHRNR